MVEALTRREAWADCTNARGEITSHVKNAPLSGISDWGAVRGTARIRSRNHAALPRTPALTILRTGASPERNVSLAGRWGVLVDCLPTRVHRRIKRGIA
jgi:hypothetical protein